MKGQLTIEFIMVLVIMLILFHSITMDLTSSATADAVRIQAGEIIRMSMITANNTLEALKYQGAGAKTSVLLRAPSDCDYLIFVASIVVSCNASSPVFSTYDGASVASSSWVVFDCPQCPASEDAKRLAGGSVGRVFITRS